MEDADRRPDLAALLAAAAHPAQAGRLARVLIGRSWPGGDDRTEPAAREWLRLWGPGRPRAEAMLRVCVCAEGRCSVCN